MQKKPFFNQARVSVIFILSVQRPNPSAQSNTKLLKQSFINQVVTCQLYL